MIKLYRDSPEGIQEMGELKEFDCDWNPIDEPSSDQQEINRLLNEPEMSASGTMTIFMSKKIKQQLHDYISTQPVPRYDRNKKNKKNRQQMMNKFQHSRKEWWIGR